MCFFKFPFSEKHDSQTEHLNGLISSCTDSMWIFKFFFAEKRESQTGHSKGFFFSWTVSTCFFKFAFREKYNSQTEHLNGLISSCTDAMWLFKQKNMNHKQSTEKAFSSHGQFQYVFSSFLFVKTLIHTWSS